MKEINHWKTRQNEYVIRQWRTNFSSTADHSRLTHILMHLNMKYSNLLTVFHGQNNPYLIHLEIIGERCTYIEGTTVPTFLAKFWWGRKTWVWGQICATNVSLGRGWWRWGCRTPLGQVWPSWFPGGPAGLLGPSRHVTTWLLVLWTYTTCTCWYDPLVGR